MTWFLDLARAAPFAALLAAAAAYPAAAQESGGSETPAVENVDATEEAASETDTAEAGDAQTEEAGVEETEAELVDRISVYLNSITTIAGEFLQLEPGNVMTEGEYAIRRPGRMYFRYEPPNPVRVVSDGVWVAVFDEEDDPAIDRYFLADLPLSLFLGDDVDLRGEGAVQAVFSDDLYHHLTIVDPSGDIDGTIELVFDKEPLRLREWTVTDADGYTTRVVLRTSTFNARVEPELFVIDSIETGDEFRD